MEADGPASPSRDGRPPEATESSSGHTFVIRGTAYACSRCGQAMDDRTVNEACPASKA